MPEPEYRDVLAYMNKVRDQLGNEAHDKLNKHVLKRDEKHFRQTASVEEVADILRQSKDLLLNFNMFLTVPFQVWKTEQEGEEIILINWDGNNNVPGMQEYNDETLHHVSDDDDDASNDNTNDDEKSHDTTTNEVTTTKRTTSTWLHLGQVGIKKKDKPSISTANTTITSLNLEDVDDDPMAMTSSINAYTSTRSIDEQVQERVAQETQYTARSAFLFARTLFKDNDIEMKDKDRLVKNVVDSDKTNYDDAVEAVRILCNKRQHIVSIRHFLPVDLKPQIWQDNTEREHIVIKWKDDYRFYIDLGEPTELTSCAFRKPAIPRPIIDLELTCHYCRQPFGPHEYGQDYRPIPSRVCEHSICHPCYHRQMATRPKKGRNAKWVDCPMCDEKRAFEVDKIYPNMLAMEVLVKVKEAKKEIDYLDQSFNIVRLDHYEHLRESPQEVEYFGY